jgi:coenzyme F420 hydrogenase subunit beta
MPAMTMAPEQAPAATAKKERWVAQWAELFDEVVTSGLCTGCAGCVVACPHDVLGYDDTNGVYKPFHLETELGPGDCTHGQKGCTSCTRACPRFRTWETEIDSHLFGREREPDEMTGISKDIILARATDPKVLEDGQDGGLVSAILMWCLDHGYIDAALVSYLEGDGSSWKAIPGVARTHDEVMKAAGSRYTYSANTMAYAEAVESGAEKLALVGMSCMSSSPPAMSARKAGKVARRFALNIGLLCSKTFDDAIFEELFEAKYGLKKQDMKKMNIKGVFQIWMKDGSYHEVPLKECHAWTREGCKTCPDFAAEHADISTGGIGAFSDWTLTIVRTDLGREILIKMLEDGTIEGRPGDDDPGAIDLLRRLSITSRRRWPSTVAVQAPKIGVPPPKKKAATGPEAPSPAEPVPGEPSSDGQPTTPPA